MFLFHRHRSARSLCSVVLYLIYETRFACFSPTPFYDGYKQIGKLTSFSGLDRSVVLIKSDADYSYPAENSAPQGKRMPIESTAIRDRINGDLRPAWRAYMLRFSPLFFSLSRMLVVILYLNLSRKSIKFSAVSIANCTPNTPWIRTRDICNSPCAASGLVWKYPSNIYFLLLTD